MMKKRSSKWGVPDAENPEWTKERFARAGPFSGLPDSMHKVLRGIQDKPQAEKPSSRQISAMKPA